MPVHDWTRVEAGVFHDFHTVWIGAIRTVLNDGLLPPDYYALAEQHIGRPITDILSLHASPAPAPRDQPPWPPATGGTAVDEAPPRVRHRQTVAPSALALRRHAGHSPRQRPPAGRVAGDRVFGEQRSRGPRRGFCREGHIGFGSRSACAAGGPLSARLHDPHGMHGEILRRLEQSDQAPDLPADEPLTLVSYAAGSQIDIYLEPVAVGAALPDMPLSLRPDRYVNVPLESTYQAAYRGLPAFCAGSWKVSPHFTREAARVELSLDLFDPGMVKIVKYSRFNTGPIVDGHGHRFRLSLLAHWVNS